jgi:hypothetical protein
VRLPLVAELRDRLLLTVGDEDRVEAEALGAARLLGDPAFEDAGPAPLFAVRREGDELAHVARSTPPALNALELGEQPFDGLTAGEACRLDPRTAAEPLDLEP